MKVITPDEQHSDVFGGNIFRRRLIKYGIWAALALIAFFIVTGIFMKVTRIDAGHVGIEINLAGSQRGPSEIPIRTGWVFI
jgi:hypothetical protein